MAEYLHSFVNLLFLSIIALFPVVNPIGSAFIVNPYLNDLSYADKKKAVKKISFYAFGLSTVALFAGHWILELFGISIPVVQVAGGIMICKIGWDSLTTDKKEEPGDTLAGKGGSEVHFHNVEDKLFYPITFPISTGAGTIAVLFTLSAHSINADFIEYLVNTAAILLGILFICILIFIFYLNTKFILKYLSSGTEKLVNRLAAFLIFCVGLQIAVSGIKALKIF
ncbi:MAG: MarC family protein [Bacteroidetes bacterium]|nr:MarC family protein [Bacteroidota bacterium]